MSNWAILCPGPSLARVSHISADPGCVIAVNSAICHRPELTRFWAVTDGEVFAAAAADERLNLCALAASPVTLWTHHNFENAGRSAEWSHEIFELFRAFSILSWKNLSDLLPVRSIIPWQNYTFFSAIALALICRASSVVIYGADLSGTGYFCKGFQNFRTDHRAKRWENEKDNLLKIINYCKKNNLANLIFRTEA